MDALTSLLAEHGLSLVFANVLLAQLGLPLPALPILIVAGALVADGTLSALPLSLAVITASLLRPLEGGIEAWIVAGHEVDSPAVTGA